MIDIILQGAINNYALEIANHYLQLPFANRIVMPSLGTGLDESIVQHHERIFVLNNRLIYPGPGNRNLQIKSSLEGVRFSDTDICVKMRSDQKISLESMTMMNEFYEQHKAPNIIFVAGIFPTFPFHPRDHIFWGQRENLLTLFNIPYDFSPQTDDYTKVLRSEAYICQWYYAQHDERAAYMVKNWQEYLLDNSPLRHEAIELSERVKLFKPFPRIDFEWPKYGMKEYHYEYTKQVYGEYQG